LDSGIKGIVQRDGSGLKWSNSEGLYLKERRRDCQQCPSNDKTFSQIHLAGQNFEKSIPFVIFFYHGLCCFQPQNMRRITKKLKKSSSAPQPPRFDTFILLGQYLHKDLPIIGQLSRLAS
jgi:hypothetical protein